MEQKILMLVSTSKRYKSNGSPIITFVPVRMAICIYSISAASLVDYLHAPLPFIMEFILVTRTTEL